MNIIINGETKDFKENINLEEMIKLLNIKTEVMAIAVNMDIVKKDDWSSFKPSENDKIEMLQFVGGG